VLLEAGVETAAGSLPLGRLLLSRRDAIISSCGMAPGSEHHEPKTVAARTDSSQSECRIFDTVRPPREKARSASVDVAAK
jgi:hypothetical protein